MNNLHSIHIGCSLKKKKKMKQISLKDRSKRS